MKSHRQISAPLAVAMILACGYAGTPQAAPVEATAGDSFSSDSRGGRTESSPPERWNYDTMPSPTPSRTPAYRLNEIAFGDNAAGLDREGIAVCRQSAAQIRSMNARQILIVGFSHRTELDPALGQDRADAVRDYLTGIGLEASRCEVASFGSRFSDMSNSQHPYMLTAAQGVEIWILEE